MRRHQQLLFFPLATTSLQQQLPLLHRRPLPCRSNNQFCTGDHLAAPADTSSYQFYTSSYQPCIGDLPAAAITSSAPAAAGPAPATTSPEPATAFLHQRSPSCTSRYQQQPVLHQRLPVLNQRPLSCTGRYQQQPVQDQRPSSCINGNQSYTSDHLSNEY